MTDNQSTEATPSLEQQLEALRAELADTKRREAQLTQTARELQALFGAAVSSHGGTMNLNPTAFRDSARRGNIVHLEPMRTGGIRARRGDMLPDAPAAAADTEQRAGG